MTAPVASYSRNFTFDQGSLGRNLATFDEKVHEFIKHDLEVTAARGEVVMKAHAPWKDETGEARAGLWCDPWWDRSGHYSILMGHTAEYGIYLEKSNGGRFQIVMPTLVAVSRAFMESLEGMLNQLDNPAPVAAIIAPGVGATQGTSQGVIEHGQHVRGAAEKPKFYFRNERGQFVSTKISITPKPKTKRTSKTGTKSTAKTKRTSTTAKKSKWAAYKGQGSRY
jgi:hypothetical protein